ncbi:MAG TPA: hypothetical protein VF295_08705 [Candidatus Limnocylindria bacterium]
MKCDDVQSLLIDGCGAGNAAARREAMEHLVECESCRDAQLAAGMLRAERGRPIPPPPPGALERAIAAATRAARPVPPPPARAPLRNGFWAGLAVGSGAMAAAAAIAWALLVPGYTPTIPELEAATTPQVTLALYEPHDVNIAVDTPSPLADAEIRVVLTGAIELDGFANQRELRWRTNLDAGANQLTLPIIATGTGGGQLLVEVHHGQKRRTFVVDVRA